MSVPYNETNKPNIFQRLARRGEPDGSRVDIRIFDNIENFEDNVAISQSLTDGESCIVYLENTSQEVKKRLLDYLHGLIYGIDGTVTAIGSDCVVCSPHNVTVQVGPGE